jgi:hypothetical protein
MLPTPPEPPPGHEQWSPSMTWRGRAIVWGLLAMIAVGTLLMLLTAVFGPPR